MGVRALVLGSRFDRAGQGAARGVRHAVQAWALRGAYAQATRCMCERMRADAGAYARMRAGMRRREPTPQGGSAGSIYLSSLRAL